ncbi:unnamed protein product [Notodromas monacha]|uniref:G-protein coupled receptors family 1 profile domain-containing protein n=1 Tax=Notodromas monacha TaxID=399045 RepID=A0A7R9BND6_9CRUS|nr:unnamed protein product [Notodromas monacha]CAG0917325.1 unnamed protein product [Notodromas monacha]
MQFPEAPGIAEEILHVHNSVDSSSSSSSASFLANNSMPWGNMNMSLSPSSSYSSDATMSLTVVDYVNNSSSAGEDVEFDIAGTASKALIGLGLSSMILASICGNLLVCIAVCTDHSLRKLGNLFVVSLAIADLLVASVVMVFATINDLMDRWIFGEKFCDTWIAMDVMCSTASIINLCAISLDRYIYIEDPYRYSRWMSKKTVTLLIACIWVVAGLVSFLPISLGLHKPPRLADEAPHPRALGPDAPLMPDAAMHCALDLTPTYAVVSSCVSFYVPCVVMVILYYRLYHYALKHVRSIKQMTRPLQLGTVNGKPAATVPTEYQVSEHKAAITIGVVVGVFLVCWVPFFCANIAEAFCKCVPKTTFQALTWLGYCNSSLNPVIYSIFNTEFRYAFHKIIAHKCPWLLCRCCGACCPDRSGKRINGNDGSPAPLRRLPRRYGGSQAEIASRVVVGVFLVCWVPFFCANIAEAFCKCVPKTTFQALTWLGYCNSSLNPVIYSIFNTEFRYAFHKIIAHKCPWLLCRCCGACCPDRSGKRINGNDGSPAPLRRLPRRYGGSQAEIASSRYSLNVEVNGLSLVTRNNDGMAAVGTPNGNNSNGRSMTNLVMPIMQCRSTMV